MHPLYVLLAVVLVPFTVTARDDDFAFELTDDLEAEFDGLERRVGEAVEARAQVGKVFHLIVPRKTLVQGEKTRNFEAKKHGGKGLPSWLLFDKKTGVFWGVPLSENVGTLHLTVRSLADKNLIQDITVEVVEDLVDESKCAQNEDNTILTLLLDKSLDAVKPKQRIVAVNNLAKFFGISYSAFMFKPQVQKDDITDSSVVLAGPGNLRSRTSKVASLLQVPVGCDGRLWVSTAPIIHQLKQQARDGTIAEVLRLPLIGWRVKTETRPIIRSKRDVDYGSGDYGDDDEYYDDYDDDYEVSGDLPESKNKPPAPTTSTTTSTTSTVSLDHHPHRHHHGEVKNSGEVIDPSVPVYNTTEKFTHEVTTTTTTTTTTTPKPTKSFTSVTLIPITESTLSKVNKQSETSPNKASDFEDDDYDYDANYDDNDDPESETEVPDITSKRTHTEPPTNVDIERITTEEAITKTTLGKDPFFPETVPPTTTTLRTTVSTVGTTKVTDKPTTIVTKTTTEQVTTFEIIEETEPAIVYTTETTTPTPTTVVASTTPAPTTVITTASTTTTSTTPATTTISQRTTSLSTERSTQEIVTEPETTVPTTTTQRQPSTTPSAATTVREIDTSERVVPARNYKPFIENRLQHMSVIAGKIFRFVIPKETFNDAEDGYNLTLEILDSNERKITNNSWLQFNPSRRELYGLPLEEDVFKWTYYIRAIDKEGQYEQESFTIQVHQHRLARVVNHEYTLLIRIEKLQEFPHNIDWALRVLRALGRVYNTNMSEITVRQINSTQEPAVFTWSNDSVATNYCPKSEIEELFKLLTANDRGDPSIELGKALAPELRVKRVVLREMGVCEEQTPIPVTPPINLAPVIRNQVDHVPGTVGELLIYKVPDDTFYDLEDADQSLNITLLTGEREPLQSSYWLQFDSKNREFFGIPFKPEIINYQLVCTDSGGLSVSDSLEVVVSQAVKKHFNVEFSMTIEVPYETFSNNAYMQRKLVEKIVEIFGETSTGNFQFLPFRKKQDSTDSTVIAWYNKSLAVEKCPHEEIKRLEAVFHNNEKSIDSRVHYLMGQDFRVSTIKVHLIGNCKKTKTPIVPVTEDVTPQKSENEYMFTFIVPVIIISIMLIVAGIGACVLYRRRRTGKMNVEEDGRQSYGNKGIPVIFQEELEEKPEPGTKAPVILKDEKPPLAPPEYSKSGSVKLDDSEPYQPPPPFTRNQDNGRQPRPKPTPTYRKPPPYVPP